MNYRKSLVASLMTLGIVSFAYQSTAQDMDVDQADTMDFGSFHKDKKEAVKVWDRKSSTTTKVYEDNPAPAGGATSGAAPVGAPATSSAKSAAPLSSAPVPSSATASGAAAVQTPPGEIGKRFEIRERYTLTRSSATPYSAFYVIEPLYKQSAQLCPRGWKKLAERSEPVEQDFYLYYLIECL
jgi:hypothetical protein